MERSKLIICLIAIVVLYYFFRYRTLVKNVHLALETFIDAVPVDEECKDMTPLKLYAKYNGDIGKLTVDLDKVGATPEIVGDVKNIPKLATLLKRNGLITCP